MNGAPCAALLTMVLAADSDRPARSGLGHAAKARPKINEQSVRILFDPAFDEKIEDLDAPNAGK